MQSVLLHGPAGHGKTTVCRLFADELNLDFVKIPLNDSPLSVRRRLFGAKTAAGELASLGDASLSNALLFLTGLQELDTTLFGEVVRLVERREYLDQNGHRQMVPQDTLIVASMIETIGAVVTIRHHLVTHFRFRIPFKDMRYTCSDLQFLAERLIGDSGNNADSPLEVTDRHSVLLHRYYLRAPDGLHAVSRWVDRWVIDRRPDVIEELAASDLLQFIPEPTYRGVNIPQAKILAWTLQFPEELRPLALHLGRSIASKYFVSQGDYHRLIQSLGEQAKLAGKDVCFCGWQSEGKSSPAVANLFKNQHHWRLARGQVILQNEPETWTCNDADAYLIVDDFVGSGRTMMSLLRSDIPRLVQRFPDARILILVLIAYERAAAEIHRKLKHTNVTLIIGRLLTEADRCFTDSSAIVPAAVDRRQLEGFCREFSYRDPLGFGDVGSVMVLPSTVPNNSLPVIWREKGAWKPLFPAQGMPM